MRADGGRVRWPTLLVLLALAAVIGSAGMSSLPPDEHEALVLRTASEMHARGDWLVPYFNGAPRLNKPPLSYWLTAATAAASGAGGAVAPWHGRLPSLLAGLGMVATIVLAGSRLYGARTAGIAGLLFATSAAFYAYGHDARPDGLYAFWCSAGLAASALALTGAIRWPRWALLAMWVCYALATLTKGPHIPALLLVGAGVWLRLERRSLVELRPGRGLLVFGAIAAPWWVALRFALVDADLRVEDSQLAGSLLRPSFDHLLNGYYLYRPLQLLLPWLPLVLIAWWTLWRAGRRPVPVPVAAQELAARVADRYFALAIVAVAVGVSFGGQQRYFYLLPVVPALCLLAGRGACLLLERSSPWWMQSLVTVTAVGYLVVESGAGGSGALAVLAAFVVGAAAWRYCRTLEPSGPTLAPALAQLIACATLVAVVLIMPTTSARMWSADRQVTAALAQAVAAEVPPTAALAAFELTPEVYVYIAARRIPRLSGRPALDAWLVEHAGRAQYLLIEVADVAELSSRYRFEVVTMMPPDADDRAGLYRLSEAPR